MSETPMSSPNTEAREPLLACYQVAKSYTGRRGQDIPILRAIDLVVHPGEIVVITGRSGTGKSTLLSLLGGLDRPTSGSIQFAGQALQMLGNEALAELRRTQIGIIFQNFNLLPSWTAFENVEAALLHTGMPPAERARQVRALLEELGLGAQLDNLPAEMSMGQQQRVAIARTLINAPSLILADEPTGDVDPETAAQIIDYLTAPVKARGATLVITTHGHFPLEIADQVLLLKDGTLNAAAETACA